MKLALIGNCAYQALIDDSANVTWLCWPRFDSSFVFGALLDDEKGGEFSIRPADDNYTSTQEYVANTNILRTIFRSASGSFEVVESGPVKATVKLSGHFSPHAGGNAAIKAATGCTVIGPAEVERIAPPDRVVKAGAVVALGDHEARVIDVGGHTNGHIAYHLDEDGVAGEID